MSMEDEYREIKQPKKQDWFDALSGIVTMAVYIGLFWVCWNTLAPVFGLVKMTFLQAFAFIFLSVMSLITFFKVAKFVLLHQ